jgi:predicted restriction endonuclease
LFDDKLNELKEWIVKNNRIPSGGSKEEVEKSLGSWCSSRRNDKKKCKLDDYKIKKLESLEGWYWEFRVPLLQHISEEEDSSSSEKEPKTTEIKVRDYQAKLRKESLELYNNKCAISNLNIKSLLEACHIKGVSFCESSKDKKNKYNTLILRKEIHPCYDIYDISINPKTMKVVVNKKAEAYNLLKEYENKKIDISDKSIDFLKWHYNKFNEKTQMILTL